MAEVYMIFARKMPKFYMIIAPKIFVPNFGGTCPPIPVSYAHVHQTGYIPDSQTLSLAIWLCLSDMSHCHQTGYIPDSQTLSLAIWLCLSDMSHWKHDYSTSRGLTSVERFESQETIIRWTITDVICYQVPAFLLPCPHSNISYTTNSSTLLPYTRPRRQHYTCRHNARQRSGVKCRMPSPNYLHRYTVLWKSLKTTNSK